MKPITIDTLKEFNDALRSLKHDEAREVILDARRYAIVRLKNDLGFELKEEGRTQ